MANFQNIHQTTSASWLCQYRANAQLVTVDTNKRIHVELDINRDFKHGKNKICYIHDQGASEGAKVKKRTNFRKRSGFD